MYICLVNQKADIDNPNKAANDIAALFFQNEKL
jgi:hypothetical protein